MATPSPRPTISNSSLAALTYPDGTETQFGYNSAGVIDQVTGRDGAVTNLTLNANGQPTQDFVFRRHGVLVYI